MNEPTRASVGLLTGVGQSLPLQKLPTIQVHTPYGTAPVDVSLGEVDGRRFAAVARRGRDERIPPSAVNYRATIWALASLGVQTLISSTVSTGLHDAFTPGTFVVPDDVLDLTHGRASSFFDAPTGADAVQVSTQTPFDTTLRSLAVDALMAEGSRVRDFGTVAVTNGPRFPSRAEGRAYAALGAHLTNMTAMPETVLARELGIGVVNVSLITDHISSDEGSTLALERRRAAAAQQPLMAGFTRLVRSIPDLYRADVHVSADAVSAVLAQSA